MFTPSQLVLDRWSKVLLFTCALLLVHSLAVLLDGAPHRGTSSTTGDTQTTWMAFLSECCCRCCRRAGAYLGLATSVLGVVTAFRPSHKAVNVFLFALLLAEIVTLTGIATTVYHHMATCVESNIVVVSPAYYASHYGTHATAADRGASAAGALANDWKNKDTADDSEEAAAAAPPSFAADARRVAAAERAARSCFESVRRLGLEAIAAVGTIVTAVGCCATQVDEALEATTTADEVSSSSLPPLRREQQRAARRGTTTTTDASDSCDDDKGDGASLDEVDDDETTALTVPKSAPQYPIAV